jgi:hypothetical protein
VRLSNIQENLTKTELIQRLQQIMQDAARAAQDVQTPQNQERARVAREEVENTQDTKNEGIHKDGARRKARPRRKKGQQADSQTGGGDSAQPSQPRGGRRDSEGHVLDITV